ncbi:MAG: Uma2 family endonuclease [Bryobacteraceae bacterium]
MPTVTYEEWLRLPEVSDATEEVVNGEVRITPAPPWSHSEIVTNLDYLIAPQVNSREVKVVTAQLGLIIRRAPLTSRVPDLAVFEKRTIVVEDGYVHSAPQLVAEVLAPAETRRGLDEKLADYAALGVPEVWVLAPQGMTVEVLYLEEGLLRCAQILMEGILTPKRFPKVKVDIAAIWPE